MSAAEINFKKQDAIRLLNEYPKLKELHELKVTDSEDSEREFWDYFLKKNYEYKTEVFGGENPVFIGFTERDEKEFQDKYVNFDIVMQPEDNEEDTEKVEVEQRLRKADKGVNFILNMDDENKPKGYGDFQPTMTVELAADGEETKDIKQLK